MKKILLTGIIVASLAVTSCDSYLDINEDPNSPSVSNMTADMLFPGAEMAFANTYGVFLRITGGYMCQHYAQNFGTSNYLGYSQFSMSAVNSSARYSNLTVRCLENMETVRALSKAGGDPGSNLAATVIRVATYQVFVDCYGEIPYSEGMDLGSLNPKYDDGKDVYLGLVAELDEAMDGLTGQETVCTNFLYGGERADAWIALANSIKLRLLMRMSGVVDVKAQLDALVAEDNFIADDAAWQGIWSDATGQANPFYQEEFASYFGSNQVNLVLNLALFNTMSDCNDSRLQVFFRPNTATGDYTGGVSGTNFATSTSYKAPYFCRPVMSYDTPLSLISRAEVEFFLAEYYARYGSNADAKTHYEEAVKASFASAGLSDADAAGVFAAYPWSDTDYARVIGVQKWVALSGVNPFEAWCELRRLGYPAMGSVTGDQIYNENTDLYQPSILPPGTLYTPIKVNGRLGANKVLQRWPYPESSSTRNPNTPAFKGYDTPVFWAK